MADLTKAEVTELVADHRTIKAIGERIAGDLAAIADAKKRIDAKLKKAAGAFPEGKTDRVRHGVRFRLVTSAGRVAWRTLLEKLKGKDYANAAAADAPKVTSCVYDVESVANVKG